MTTAVANLAQLLQHGPPRGDVCKGLEELRYTVLADGIPSNSDGIVKLRTPKFRRPTNV